MKGLRLYLKNKVFYSKVGSSYKKIGPALDFAKKLKSSFDLLHIIDRELCSGKNLDIYDSLTQFIHIQLEMPRICYIEQLYSMNMRMAFVPPNFPEEIKYKFSLLKTEDVNDLDIYSKFKDVLTSNIEVLEKANMENKRVFFIGKNKDAFCEIIDHI